MAENLYKLLNDLEELEQKIRDTVEEIKFEAKKEAMREIQSLLSKGNNDEAKRMIDEIEDLKALSLSVNTRAINEFVQTMLNMESEKRRFLNNNSGTQFKYERKAGKEDLKEMMARKGYEFVEFIEGKMKFKKDDEFFYAVELNNDIHSKELEDTLKDSSKFCNLVFITDSEYAKSQLKDKVVEWIDNSSERQVLKKYLTIQMGSYEHLNQKGTVLEKINLA